MRRTRSLFGAAVICSVLLSSAQGDRPERKTYLRRLVDDSLASGLSTLEQLMTASIVSGTGSDAATAAKATAGGQENAARTPLLPPQPKRTMIAQPPRAQLTMTAQQLMMTA